MNKKYIVSALTLILCFCLLLFAGGASCKPEGYEEQSEDGEITEMFVTVNDNKLKVELCENSAVDELVEILKQGDITYTAHANSFEIYGDIGHNLTAEDTYITSEPGDVLLYIGSNICIFFDNNSWQYTRIGKINGYSADELQSMLGGSGGNVQVTISLK